MKLPSLKPYVIVTIGIFAAMLIGGLSKGPWNMPVAQWFLALGLKKSPILVAVDVEGNFGRQNEPIALLSLVGRGTQDDKVLSNMLMRLGLVDPPPLAQTALPRTLAIMDLNGNMVRRLGQASSLQGADWKVCLSSNCKRVIWAKYMDIYTCVLPNGTIERPDFLNGVGSGLGSPLACRMSADGSAALLAYMSPEAMAGEADSLPLALKWVDFDTGESRTYVSFYAPGVVDRSLVTNWHDWLNLVCDISADGSRLLIAKGAESGQSSSVFLLEPRADRMTQLTDNARFNDYCPAFVPSGDAICFIRMPDHSREDTDIGSRIECRSPYSDASVVYRSLSGGLERKLTRCSYSYNRCQRIYDCLPSFLISRKSSSEKFSLMLLDFQPVSPNSPDSNLELVMRAGILSDDPPVFSEYVRRLELSSDFVPLAGYLGVADGVVLMQHMFGGPLSSMLQARYSWMTRDPDNNYRLSSELYPAPGAILAWSGE